MTWHQLNDYYASIKKLVSFRHGIQYTVLIMTGRHCLESMEMFRNQMISLESTCTQITYQLIFFIIKMRSKVSFFIFYSNLLCLNTDTGERSVLLSSPAFSSYTVMDVSTSGQLVAIGNIHGSLCILDIQGMSSKRLATVNSYWTLATCKFCYRQRSIIHQMADILD